MVKRSRLEIIGDMLHTLANAGGHIKPTHLMYKSNLSHGQMKLYLEELGEKGFVEDGIERKKKVIRITEKGMGFLQKLRDIREFEEGFGL